MLTLGMGLASRGRARWGSGEASLWGFGGLRVLGLWGFWGFGGFKGEGFGILEVFGGLEIRSLEASSLEDV